MEKRIYFIIIMFLVTSLLSSCDTPDFSVNISANIKDEESKSLFIYQYVQPSRKEISADVERICENLNFFVDARFETVLLKNRIIEERLSFKTENNSFFDMYKPSAKAFIYSKPLEKYLRPQIGIQSSDMLLKKRESITISEDFLKKLDIYPEDTENDRIYIENVSTIRGASSENKEKIYDFLRVVRYGRKLNGLRVVGPTRIVVRLAGEGELVSVIKYWPALSSRYLERTNDLVEKKRWTGLVRKHLEETHKGSESCSGVDVDNIELVMYDDGKGCIEPVLYVRGNRILKSGQEIYGDWFVPVLVNPKAIYPSQKIEQ